VSFGKKKMYEISDELAGDVLIGDARGNEWIVIALENGKRVYHYGCVNPRTEQETRFKADKLAAMSDHFRAWAKKVEKEYDRRMEKETENA
jgi:hypothetical protein